MAKTLINLLNKISRVLSRDEKRKCIIALAPISTSAITSALMIASLMPFMTVLTNSEAIREDGFIAELYQITSIWDEQTFTLALGLLAVVMILISSAMNIARVYAIQSLTDNITFGISTRLFTTFLEQDYEFFLSRNSSDMSAKVLSESEQFVFQVLRPIADGVASSLTILSILTFLVLINPQVATIAFSTLGFVYYITFSLSRKSVRRLGRQRVIANTDRYQIATEAFQAIKDLKIYNSEKEFIGKFVPPAAQLARGRMKASVIAELPRYIVEASALSGIVISCLIAFSHANQADTTGSLNIISTLTVFALAAQKLIPELQRCYAASSKLQYGAPLVSKIYADFQNSSKTQTGSQGKIKFEQEIHLNNISYSYKNSKNQSLKKVNLKVKKGETLAIVGPSGSGKSTLADTLLGLLTPAKGEISIDGRVLEKGDLVNWRAKVAYVPQEIFLTHDTLNKNIAFGEKEDEIDHQRILMATRLSNLEAFIRENFAHGLETKIGERGSSLSGGQRQRVGIARALYRDSELIVFDEATSALDNITESTIVDAIAGLKDQKTIIVIAHRLSTIRNADRIIVMCDGEVSAVGTWDELVQSSSIFNAMTAPTKHNGA